MKIAILFLTITILASACGNDCDDFTPEIMNVSNEMLICFDSVDLPENCSTFIKGESQAFLIPVEFTQNPDCPNNPYSFSITNTKVTSDSDILINNSVLINAGTNLLALGIDAGPVLNDQRIFLSTTEEFLLLGLDSNISSLATIYGQESAVFNFEFTARDTDTYYGSNTFMFDQ